jgi:phenylacetate-coenzyme A ligase PaaK-like adenylate-forming protein
LLASPLTRGLALAWEVHSRHQARKVRRLFSFTSAPSCICFYREADDKKKVSHQTQQALKDTRSLPYKRKEKVLIDNKSHFHLKDEKVKRIP